MKSESRAPQMTVRAGFAVSGIDLHGMVPSNRRILEVDSGGRADRSFRAAVKFGRPELPQHICPCTLARDGTFGDRVKQTP